MADRAWQLTRFGILVECGFWRCWMGRGGWSATGRQPLEEAQELVEHPPSGAPRGAPEGGRATFSTGCWVLVAAALVDMAVGDFLCLAGLGTGGMCLGAEPPTETAAGLIDQADRLLRAWEPGKNLHIHKLEIRNATVNLKLLHIKGKFGTTPLPLDEIILTDLGTDKKLNVAQLTGIILKALVGGIMEKGQGIIPQEILGPLGDTMKILGDVTGQILKEGGKVLDQGGKATGKVIEGGGKVLEEGGKGLEGIGKGIGDLLKPKDKDKEKEEK